ncbi:MULTISPECIES: BldC family transcriptional regulator [unclassified Nocardiopsis]|nr:MULTISPECIES: BldC family transcriptional regulator [unclassified Nocardiopsis]
MTPREVARVLRVDTKTVTRWADEGRLTPVRTPGGHRRFSRAEVRAVLTGRTSSPARSPTSSQH